MAETLEYVSAAIVAAGGRVRGSKGCYVRIWNGGEDGSAAGQVSVRGQADTDKGGTEEPFGADDCEDTDGSRDELGRYRRSASRGRPARMDIQYRSIKVSVDVSS